MVCEMGTGKFMIFDQIFREGIRWIKRASFLHGKLGLARKLILVYALVLLIPIAVFAVTFLNNSRSDTEQNALGSSKQVVQYVRMNIDRNVDEITRAAQSAISNTQFMQFLSEPREYSSTEWIDFKNSSLREIENIRNLNPGIYQLRIFLDNPLFDDIWPTIYSEEFIKNDPIWQNTMALKGKTYWELNLAREHVPENMEAFKPARVSLFREVRYPANMHLGIIEVAMQASVFYGDLDKYHENENSFFTIFSGKDRKVVFSTNSRFMENNGFTSEAVGKMLGSRISGASGDFRTELNKIPLLAVYDYIGDIDSYICYFTAASGYLKQMERAGSTVIVISLAAFVLLVVLTYFLTTVILKKIKVIVATMRMIEEGAVNVDLPAAGKDEIGEMAFHMRKMLGRIKELVGTLDAVQGELQKGENAEERIREVNDLVYQFRIHELNYVLLNDNLSEIEIKNILDTIKIENLRKDSRQALLAAYGRAGEKEMNPPAPGELKLLIDRFADDSGIPVFSFVDTEKHLVFITDHEWDFQGLATFIEESGLDFIVSLSGRIGKATAIRKAYLEAYEALKYRLVPDCGRVIQYDSVKLLSENYSIPAEDIKKIQQLVYTNKEEKIAEILDAVFEKQKINAFKHGYIEKTVECISHYIVEYFLWYIPNKAGLDGSYSSLAGIGGFRCVDDYTAELKRFIREICRFLRADKNEGKQADEIDSALAYINGNYHKELSLTMVANHVSLNYNYFSSLFNERTGMSFVDYLKRIRMEQAKELLRSTDLKIQEVAFRVGYENPKYFTRVFRESTGVSPQEYKK